MTGLVILLVAGALMIAFAVRADSRLHREARLPMQWTLSGDVTWTAPRRIALAFIPAMSIATLAFFVVLMRSSKPRPGQEHLVIPVLALTAAIFVASQLFHLWMIDRSLRKRDG